MMRLTFPIFGLLSAKHSEFFSSCLLRCSCSSLGRTPLSRSLFLKAGSSSSLGLPTLPLRLASSPLSSTPLVVITATSAPRRPPTYHHHSHQLLTAPFFPGCAYLACCRLFEPTRCRERSRQRAFNGVYSYSTSTSAGPPCPALPCPAHPRGSVSEILDYKPKLQRPPSQTAIEASSEP
jgi:hypothetical protein